MPTALLFPGQGSQTPGMRELAERRAPALVEVAVEEAGEDPFARIDAGTAYVQPAIVCASLAAWTAAGRPTEPLNAGHSLGELSALAAAGAIDTADAVRLAATRGRLMQDAAGSEPGGMLALLGDPNESRDAAAAAGVTVANDNGPTQLVVAGPEPALKVAAREAKVRGVRAIRLPVRGAFHSPAMEPAIAPYRAALAEVGFEAPSLPVFSSAAARPFPADGEAIRDLLAAAIARQVRWRETLDELHARGVRRFREVGPGKVLTGMVRRALQGVDATVLEAEPAHA